VKKHPEQVLAGFEAVTVLPVGPLRAQRQIWVDTVGSKEPGFFGKDAGAILEKYCIALDRSRFIAQQINNLQSKHSRVRHDRYQKLLEMERKTAALVALLATKMRLTQQARYKPDSAVARSNPPEMPPPWQNRE
jgi:hypothetical protein